MKTLALATAGLMTLFAADAAPADDARRHVDNVAYELELQTRQLVREFRYGFRRHPEFEHLYEDAVEMNRLAQHVHGLTHNAANLTTLQNDVAELDELFHHVEELLDTRIGHGHGFGSAYHQRKAGRLMAVIEDTLHHLQDDVDDLARRCRTPGLCPSPAPVPTIGRPDVRPYPYPRQVERPGFHRTRSGFRFRTGDGRFGISIGVR